MVCDSLYDDIDNTTKNSVEAVFHGSHLCYSVPAVPKQEGPMDCDLYAIAYATYLVYGKDPQCLTTHYYTRHFRRKRRRVYSNRLEKKFKLSSL